MTDWEKELATERTKIISDMLDNPDEYGIYPTTKCFQELDDLIKSKIKEAVEDLNVTYNDKKYIYKMRGIE